jgi:hypothetical protein
MSSRGAKAMISAGREEAQKQQASLICDRNQGFSERVTSERRKPTMPVSKNLEFGRRGIEFGRRRRASSRYYLATASRPCCLDLLNARDLLA